MTPPSNANQIAMRIPAFLLMEKERCCECEKQYVTAEGVAICEHQVVRHWDGREKKICRPCWNNWRVKAKYGAESPWEISEYVTK